MRDIDDGPQKDDDDENLDERAERLKREEREAREETGDEVAGDWSGEADGAGEAGQ